MSIKWPKKYGDEFRVTKLDGFQLIKEIINLKSPKPKIIILTGHIDIEEQLKQRGLPFFPIISKPIVYTDIERALKS